MFYPDTMMWETFVAYNFRLKLRGYCFDKLYHNHLQSSSRPRQVEASWPWAQRWANEPWSSGKDSKHSSLHDTPHNKVAKEERGMQASLPTGIKRIILHSLVLSHTGYSEQLFLKSRMLDELPPVWPGAFRNERHKSRGDCITDCIFWNAHFLKRTHLPKNTQAASCHSPRRPRNSEVPSPPRPGAAAAAKRAQQAELRSPGLSPAAAPGAPGAAAPSGPCRARAGGRGCSAPRRQRRSAAAPARDRGSRAAPGPEQPPGTKGKAIGTEGFISSRTRQGTQGGGDGRRAQSSSRAGDKDLVWGVCRLRCHLLSCVQLIYQKLE